MDRRAYLLAFAALGLWSGLASVAAALNGHDALLVAGLGLAIGGLAGLPGWRAWRVPPITWLVGVGGILGYHALYFAAFARAPAVAVNLVNYLWPLLTILLAPLVLGGRLTARHVGGALLGLLGTATVIARDGLHLGGAGSGYALAGAAALVWAAYSLLTKRLPPFPTAAVGGFCLVSGLAALGLAACGGGIAAGLAAFSAGDWALLVGVGLGPLGAAFWCWDAALKRGDPRTIATLAYFAPLLSTLWLVLLGGGRLDWRSAVALVLIVAGAALGSARADSRGKQPD
jgi:drug/metabolite transporter (DMT)-like permease